MVNGEEAAREPWFQALKNAMIELTTIATVRWMRTAACADPEIKRFAFQVQKAAPNSRMVPSAATNPVAQASDRVREVNGHPVKTKSSQKHRRPAGIRWTTIATVRWMMAVVFAGMGSCKFVTMALLAL